MKKHKTQMTYGEIDLLRAKVDATDIATIEITAYTLNRMKERLNGIELLDVAKTFLDYELIEYNRHSSDHRVLIRGNENIQNGIGSYNICIVYSMLNNRIVTIWKENDHDHHDTLRIEEYNQDLEIVLDF